MRFRERRQRELIEASVPAGDDSLTTATRLLEYMSARHVFGTLGVADVWLTSDGDDGYRLEMNLRGWGVYQSPTLFPG